VLASRHVIVIAYRHLYAAVYIPKQVNGRKSPPPDKSARSRTATVLFG